MTGIEKATINHSIAIIVIGLTLCFNRCNTADMENRVITLEAKVDAITRP
jgi:hypothetical protein